MEVITNHQPREIIDAAGLTHAEHAEFDYLDWSRVDTGQESGSFIRYRGQLYDLAQFTVDLPTGLAGTWHGIRVDSFCTALVVRYNDPECDTVVVGRVST